MKHINILCPFDFSSKVAGASFSINLWRKVLPAEDKIEISRDYADAVPYICPVVFGGDHCLTFYIIRCLAQKYNQINLVMFDAHHDQYELPYLNHYTFCHHLKRLYSINIYLIGGRYECNNIRAISNLNTLGLIKGPIYISLDVDFFSPKIVRGVGHAVSSIDSDQYSSEFFTRALKFINNNLIIGADIVEWTAVAPDDTEFDCITSAVNSLITTIDMSF